MSTREQNRAYSIVRRARKAGTLVQEACEFCGDPETFAHHRHGYEDALRVTWLCSYHHSKEHLPGGRRRGLAPVRVLVWPETL